MNRHQDLHSIEFFRNCPLRARMMAIDAAAELRALGKGSLFPLFAMVVILFGLGAKKAAAQAYPPANPFIQPLPNQQSGYAQSSQYAPPSGYGQQQPYPQQQGYPQSYDQQQPYPPQQQGYGQQQPYPPQQQGYGQQQYDQQPYDQQAPYGQQAYDQPQTGAPDDYGQAPAQPAQPLDAGQLEQLVAPIALYPDTLIAQILAAATYPAQVVAADRWRQSMGYAPPDQVVAGADGQTWDPSVKALTAFPQTLSMMDRNLQWTTALGNAYYNDPQDVLQTIQVMRQRAEAAGTLQSTPQETVSDDNGYIQLAPATPAVVYVPQYNPWDAYGEPVQPYSGFSWLGTIGSALLNYGPGIAMGAFRATPWGALSWGLDWLANTVLFHHNSYYSHSTSVARWNLPPRTPRGIGERAGIPGERAGIPGERYNRFAGGNGFAGGQLPHRPMPLGREPQQFAGNRPFEGPRQGFNPPDRNGVRPAFGNEPGFQGPAARPQPWGNRPGEFAGRPQPLMNRPQQQAFNRAPEPVRPGYGNGFASRPGESYGFRGGEGFARPMQESRPPEIAQRGSFGERFGQPQMGRGFGGQQFKPEKSGGGLHLFGGGHNSEPSFGSRGEERMPKSFREPKMPKSFGHEKMPKAPHFSGGHSHSSGGGHFGGGHHR